MNNQALPTEKKQWITPKVEIISKDVIQGGIAIFYTEGQFTITNGTLNGTAS